MRPSERLGFGGAGILAVIGGPLVANAYVEVGLNLDALLERRDFRIGSALLALAALLALVGVVSLLLQRRYAPILHLAVPKVFPSPGKGLNQGAHFWKNYPYESDMRMSGGQFMVPTTYKRVELLPLTVTNKGRTRAEAVRAEITALRKPGLLGHRPKERLPIPVQWRRDQVGSRTEETIPPRGGRAQVCLLEFESWSGSRHVYPPADTWESPVILTVVVSCDGAKSRRIRLRLEGIQGHEGDPRVKRLRWWRRR
jgi:hypothetical protein